MAIEMSPTKKRKLNHFQKPNAKDRIKVQKAEKSSESETDVSDAEEEPEPVNKRTSLQATSKEKDHGANGDTTDQAEAVEEKEYAKTFKELGIIDQLCEACESLGYKAPTPIQAESIPLALQGKDLIGLAETGSGKTAAFALPILQALMETPQQLFGLVLAPTRELAYQISQAFEALGSLIGVKCAVIVGGMEMVPQAIALGKKPHIVVATPGRLLDHLENTKGFSLRSLRYLVMDEADRMLDLDFATALDKILRVLPRDTRRTMLFSATMTAKVDALQRASLRNPVRVSISTSAYQTVATLLQSYLFFPHHEKDVHLVALLNEHAGRSAIVFARTVNETQRLALLLRALGLAALPLHGQLGQSARLGALAKFRARARCDVLVATDVAARGLDVPRVDLVLNYDLPADSATYVHRVGRTARAGRAGRALSFVTQYDVEVWQRIEAAVGRRLPEYKELEREHVLVFGERVAEAQRRAVREMKDLHENRGKKGALLKRTKGWRKGKAGSRDDMDKEEM